MSVSMIVGVIRSFLAAATTSTMTVSVHHFTKARENRTANRMNRGPSKTSRSRVAKRAGSESSQESLSLPPPSPADQLHLYLPSPADHILSFPPPSPADPMLSLSSPDTNHTMLVGPSDPMLSMPPPSPVDSLLPTVLGSPPILNDAPSGNMNPQDAQIQQMQ